VASDDFVLFHRITDPASAEVRREIVRRGLKARIDFQNIEEDEARALFDERRGSAIPALWDGNRLTSGRDAILERLARLGT
jgi:hypothetical protein